jgi:hypothetical protein
LRDIRAKPFGRAAAAIRDEEGTVPTFTSGKRWESLHVTVKEEKAR